MVQGFHTLKAKVISLLMLIYKHRSVTQDRVRLLLGYSEHKWLWSTAALAAEEVVADGWHLQQRLHCGLQHAGDIQQAGLLPWLPHELQPDWQTCMSSQPSHPLLA